MRKTVIYFILAVCLFQSAQAQQKLFDKQAQIKSCHIRINANAFIANTSIELELYNPGEQEIEAMQVFNFTKDQLVTGLQLQLDGKYRKGSIEERWKASNAYNTIVGKRIDPALLQMWGGQYWLNVYPVPAKGSRKVIIELCQAMKPKDDELQYQLPLSFSNEVDTFSVEINVKKETGYPVIKKGLLHSLNAVNAQRGNHVLYAYHKIKVNTPVEFSVITGEAATVFSCLVKDETAASFHFRFNPAVVNYRSARLDSLTVFWDVSRIANGRNIEKELLYLERYITENRTRKVDIVLFNDHVIGTIRHNAASNSFRMIRNYLESYNYSGGSFLGKLDFSKVKAGAVLLFSDGYNSFGNALPVQGTVPVHCIVSGYTFNREAVNKITGVTGGRMIRVEDNFSYNTRMVVQPDEQYILGYESAGKKIILDQQFPIPVNGPASLSGKILASDSLKIFFGNGSGSIGSQSFYFSTKAPCDTDTYNKIKLLYEYDSVMKNPDYYWSNQVVFGLTNRIVTPYTSFLVLERIEDYIKYNIAPPEELEEKCRAMNYVYKSGYQLQKLKVFTEEDALKTVVANFNKRIARWDSREPLIDMSAPLVVDKPGILSTVTGNAGNDSYVINGFFNTGRSELKEIVVTGAFGTKRVARSMSTNVQYIYNEQANVIRQQNVNNALAGKVAGIQVRSQSAAKLGVETSIRLRGENSIGMGGSGALYVVDGTIIPNGIDINPDDIDDYTILHGPSASALFGPDGAYGAIVMNTKKGRRGAGYWFARSFNCTAENEDYMEAISGISSAVMEETYEELKQQHEKHVGFYFEMARYFYQQKRTAKAMEILIEGADQCMGNAKGMHLVANILEEWKLYGKAIDIYKGLVEKEPKNLQLQRELAMAFYQDHQYQQALDLLNTIIKTPGGTVESGLQQDMALTEMNMIIALHHEKLNLAGINPYLVKPMPANLRIVISLGRENAYNQEFFSITEPGESVCSIIHPNTKNGGMLLSNELNYNNLQLNNGFSNEYIIRNAPAGAYKLKMKVGEQKYNIIPHYTKVMIFKNFQQPGQSIEIRMLIAGKDDKEMKIDDIKWQQ